MPEVTMDTKTEHISKRCPITRRWTLMHPAPNLSMICSLEPPLLICVEPSLAMDPLYSADPSDKTPRQTRKRRLIIDEPLMSFSSSLQPLDFSPPTRKHMKLRNCGNVGKLFHLPGNDTIKSKPIV